MNDHWSFSRAAATTALGAAALALFSTFIAIAAVGFDFELLDEPVGLLAIGPRAARLFRWGWILAGFGFHLFLVPVALYLEYWLKSQKPNWVRLYTVFGLGYCLIGAISLFTMATVLSPMMGAHGDALAAERDLMVAVFQANANLAFASLGTLSFILGGVWWLGIGLVLRTRHNLLGLATVVLGTATLASGLGYLFQAEALARLEVFFFFLGPWWAVWLGIVILRDGAANEPMVASATFTRERTS